MKRAHAAPAAWLALVIVLSIVATTGCGPGDAAARVQRQLDARPEMLFGATALPMGGEDLGYFASLDTRTDGVVPFSFSTVYLRRTVHDVENSRRPFTSGHRTRVYSVEQQLWFDQRY